MTYNLNGGSNYIFKKLLDHHHWQRVSVKKDLTLAKNIIRGNDGDGFCEKKNFGNAKIFRVVRSYVSSVSVCNSC